MTHFPSFSPLRKKEKKRRKSTAERARTKEQRALNALTKEIEKKNGRTRRTTWEYTF